MGTITKKTSDILKTSSIYGFIFGDILIAVFAICIVASIKPYPFVNDWKMGMLILFINISALIMACKALKDKQDGYMSYGQGFGVSFLTHIIANFIYLFATLIYVNFIDGFIYEEYFRIKEYELSQVIQNRATITSAIELTRKMFVWMWGLGILLSGALYAAIVPIFMKKNKPESIL